MKIKRDGIYKTIDSKDFGIYQKSGWEKVIIDIIPKEEPVKEEQKLEPIDEEKLGETNIEEEPIVEKVKVKEEKPIDELPKSKKKKK